jgi:hypothetical protein
MGGFLFALAFVLCTLACDRRSIDWRVWAGGSFLGALPMVPWLMALATVPHRVSVAKLINLAPVFIARWFDMATGVGLRQSFGNSFEDFIAQPSVGGHATYFVAALLATSVFLVMAIVVRLILRLRIDRQNVTRQFFSLQSPTVLALVSAFLGYGLLLSATLRHTYIHYFVITFSLPALSLAWLAHAGAGPTAGSQRTSRLLLAGLVFAQAAVTSAFLLYIHDREVIDGDYGVVYRALPLSAR